jgi:hypothetical protein
MVARFRRWLRTSSQVAPLKIFSSMYDWRGHSLEVAKHKKKLRKQCQHPWADREKTTENDSNEFVLT